MEKFNDISRWIFRNFFLIAIAIFITIYWRWYQINPISDSFPFGLVLLAVYTISAIFLRVFKRKSCLQSSFLITTIFFFLANIIHATIYMPQVLDSANFYGVKYYISYSSQFLDPQWTLYSITKRWGMFSYRSNGLGSAKGDLKLKYDKTTDKVIVVRSFPAREILAYIDDDNPRFYETDVELENHIYYLFSSCKRLGEDCSVLTYFLYECELDNTFCKRLPFEYEGEYGGYMGILESNETTSEINVLFDVYFGTEPKEILIFTYGDAPRCYVEGCEIMETLK